MSVAIAETNGAVSEGSSLSDVLNAAMDRKNDADRASAEAVEASYETEGDEPTELATEPTTAVEETSPEETAGAETATIEPVVSPTADGPSPEWLDLAKGRNIPDTLLSYCKSNDDVQRMILEFGDAFAGDPEPTTAAADDWEVKLPFKDDEFDATDPMHVWAKQQTDAHNKLLKAFDAVTSGLESIKEESAVSARVQLSQQFDKAIDALGVADFGKSMSPQRKEVFALFDALQKSNPTAPIEELTRRAAMATKPEAFAKKATEKQLAAQMRQGQQSVGGGAAPPAPTKPLDSREKWLQELRSKLRR